MNSVVDQVGLSELGLNMDIAPGWAATWHQLPIFKVLLWLYVSNENCIFCRANFDCVFFSRRKLVPTRTGAMLYIQCLFMATNLTKNEIKYIQKSVKHRLIINQSFATSNSNPYTHTKCYPPPFF